MLNKQKECLIQNTLDKARDTRQYVDETKVDINMNREGLVEKYEEKLRKMKEIVNQFLKQYEKELQRVKE
jgi:hypothetical protein